ncbi:hypothetical protein BKA93DRAFT_735834, partial [Sparassis latifolia]
VNHLQHQMSSQTFKAQVAVSSWVGTPLLLDMKACAEFIETKKRPAGDKEKVWEVVVVE